MSGYLIEMTSLVDGKVYYFEQIRSWYKEPYPNGYPIDYFKDELFKPKVYKYRKAAETQIKKLENFLFVYYDYRIITSEEFFVRCEEIDL